MTPETLTCPNCGAPLALAEDQALALCLYCDTVVRLAGSEATQPDFERAAPVAPETVRKIKQSLLIGQRGDAIRLYQQAAGVDEAQAATAVLAFSRQIALGVVQSQRAQPAGRDRISSVGGWVGGGRRRGRGGRHPGVGGRDPGRGGACSALAARAVALPRPSATWPHRGPKRRYNAPRPSARPTCSASWWRFDRQAVRRFRPR